jgi:hypothetical protein
MTQKQDFADPKLKLAQLGIQLMLS